MLKNAADIHKTTAHIDSLILLYIKLDGEGYCIKYGVILDTLKEVKAWIITLKKYEEMFSKVHDFLTKKILFKSRISQSVSGAFNLGPGY